MQKYSESVTQFIKLVDELARFRGRQAELFRPVYGAAGMSQTEMAILNAVIEARTPPTIPRIGRSLGHARQLIQRTANGLIERGLLETMPNPDHKRAVLLVATPRARQIKAEADRLARDIASPLVNDIDAERIRTANEVLHDLRSAIENASRGTTKK